ncbi:hypothetical protein NBEOAGPD_3300 [Methylobacterium gregans]|uniref:Uncharacterized protein n=1 Tax=Methylobacterium gregans TaxID=374424 RepID=A0AA37HQP2_9HYPH|nr:hypothetical protein [Methylobacterium gregans]GJD80065.1 hypothetical protein NBEOAGPD_3300 [Methylobacterium gregans]
MRRAFWSAVDLLYRLNIEPAVLVRSLAGRNFDDLTPPRPHRVCPRANTAGTLMAAAGSPRELRLAARKL